MIRQRRYKCLHCRKLFYPDRRNHSRQQYCSKPDCRRASKAASQKKWLTKPENRDYFRSPENTKRVQQWRKDNPGYWRKERKVQEPLQDRSTRENTKNQQDIPNLQNVALQDLLSTQATVFLGLLAHLGGSPLQDDIVIMGRRLQQLGRDILNESFNPEGGRHDSQQIPHSSTSGPPGSRTVQLDRSSSGA